MNDKNRGAMYYLQHMARKIDVAAMEAFLQRRDVETRSVITNGALRHTKVMGYEKDRGYWHGQEPPKITIEYDPGRGWLLSAKFNWNAQRNSMDGAQILELFVRLLSSHSIIVAAQDGASADGAEDDEFDEEVEEVLVDPEQDAAQLLKHRQIILFGPKNKASWKAASVPGAAEPSETASMTAADKEFMKSQDRQKLGKDEETFNTDVSATNPMDYVWRDKYKPRKPRFFNRVHTGFEWNKYNQTHYDSDNPPPKIVQGYKFNIFYPDLVKRREIPQYELSPLPDEPGFAILKFKAGPPYEDLAFKVVNKQWEMGRQRGFRSQFQHNVLQVWFHFRRERYRR